MTTIPAASTNGVAAPAIVDAADVHVSFDRGRGSPRVQAVSGASITIERGETVGLVGESGCGKSTLGRALIGIQPIDTGTVRFDGQDLARESRADRRRRSRRTHFLFQDPYSSLDPRMRVHDLVAEPLRIHGEYDRHRSRHLVEQLLQTVGLTAADARRYPHQFSGGQRQRICIARALILEPELVVLDEPVSALDVSVQAAIVDLLRDLSRRRSLSYLFISHDLAVVRQIADRVAVMYLGKIVECGPIERVFDQPAHPYTQALLSAVPAITPSDRRERIVLSGDVPSPTRPPSGCRFRTRCPHAVDRCASEEPRLSNVAATADHEVSCHLAR